MGIAAAMFRFGCFAASIMSSKQSPAPVMTHRRTIATSLATEGLAMCSEITNEPCTCSGENAVANNKPLGGG